MTCASRRFSLPRKTLDRSQLQEGLSAGLTQNRDQIKTQRYNLIKIKQVCKDGKKFFNVLPSLCRKRDFVSLFTTRLTLKRRQSFAQNPLNFKRFCRFIIMVLPFLVKQKIAKFSLFSQIIITQHMTLLKRSLFCVR